MKFKPKFGKIDCKKNIIYKYTMLYIIFFLILIFIYFNQERSLKLETFSTRKPVVLITQYYKPKWQERLNEINDCLKLNIKNKYIDKIILFMEEDCDISDFCINTSKVKKEIINQRLNYKFVFKYANKKLENYIVVLSNSDIYFNDSLKKLHSLKYNDTVYAITRYNENPNDNSKMEIQPNGLNSQDTWIWSGKINIINNKYFRDDGIQLGVFGCDNLIAGLLKKSKYKVRNTCKKIITIHKHKEKKLRNHPTKRYGKMSDYHFVSCEPFTNIYFKHVVFMIEITDKSNKMRINNLLFFKNFMSSFYKYYKKNNNYSFYLGYHTNNNNYMINKYKILNKFYENSSCNTNLNLWLFEIDPNLVIQNELKTQLQKIKLNSYFYLKDNFNFTPEWFSNNLQ
jgi:hypothetical protein